MTLVRCSAALLLSLFTATIAAAAPELKALLIDGQNNHNFKGTTPPMKKTLEESGLFTVDVLTSPAGGEDMSHFKPNFAAYNVVVLNYNGADWPAETRDAFEKYVSRGGGLVVVHAADNSFPNWKAYNEMIAVGGWGNRNEKSGPYLYWKDGKIVRDTSPGSAGAHGPQHAFQLIVREANHPITKGLPEKFMHSPDELYALLRGPAKNVTVLATAYNDPNFSGNGHHEPMLMAIDFGKGRVFHTAIGHDAQQCKSVAFIVTLQRGTEWAATGKVTQALPKDFPSADQPSMR